MPRILTLELSPGVYLVTVRDERGALLARLTGPAGWCLEQLAHGLVSPSASPPASPPRPDAGGT